MKKIFITIIAILLPLVSNADDSGKCGDNMTYTYESATKTLTISGTGAMYDYTDTNRPWKYSVKHVVVNEGVTTIGKNAFHWFSEIVSVKIPSTIIKIGEYAFGGCLALSSVRISDLESWCCINFVGKNANPLTYSGRLFVDDVEIKDLVIPNNIKNIKDFAFSGANGLKSVTIPDGVTSIGECAFCYCSGLTSLTIPNSVTSIDHDAFEYCTGLNSVNLSENLTCLELNLFADCSSLTYISIPDKVTSINSGAFAGCSSLESIMIPSKVSFIGSSAFSDCISLSSIVIPNSVKTIERSAFSGCYKLVSVTLPNNITELSEFLFAGCSGFTDVTIPNTVTNIAKGAFRYCSGLKSIVIPGSVKNIGDLAFEGTNLSYVISQILNPNPFNGKANKNNTIIGIHSFYNTILYVPVGTIDKYKGTEGWSGFAYIEEKNTDDGIQQCAKPTISFENGKLHFGCETDGVRFVYNIITDKSGLDFGNNVEMPLTVTIAVYATKIGYNNSEVTTTNLAITRTLGDLNYDGDVNVADHVRLSDIILNIE